MVASVYYFAKTTLVRLLGLHFICLASVIFSPTCVKGNIELNVVLSAVQKLMSHYKNDYQNLNLDGFFGLRILEGHLQLLISEHSLGRHRHLSKSTLQQIVALKEASQNLTALGMKAVEHDNAEYFKAFNPVVSEPWKVIKPHRKLDPSLRWEIPQYKAKLNLMRKNFTESASDKCMTEILSSDSLNCIVSENCVKLMTSRGFTGYPITHQLLWSMLVEDRPKCQTAVEKHGLKSIDDLQLELCTNNFYEMVAVVEVLMHGSVHQSHQDLFLEQQFVCPSVGFYEFLKKDYLDQIISWQFPSGCYGELEDGSKEDEGEQIDFSALLEEYNGDKLRFVPEVTGDYAKTHNFGSRFSLHHAHKAVQRESNNIKRNHKKTVVNVFKPGINENNHGIGESAKFQDQVLPKLNHAMAASNRQGPGNQAGESKVDVLFEPADHDAYNVGRHLLVEKKMAGGCLSHKTGVAAGALVMYLRYLIEPGDIKWEGQHDLLLKDTRNLLQAQNDDNNAEEEDEEGEEEEEGAAAGNIQAPAEIGENEDEGDEDEEDDNNEMEDMPNDNDYQRDEYNNEDPEYDSDGNPVAAEGGLINEDPQDHIGEESFIQKQGDVHERNNMNQKIPANILDAPEGGQKVEEKNHLPLDDMPVEMKFDRAAAEEASQQEEEGHFYDDDIGAEKKGGIKQRPPTFKPLPPEDNFLGTAALERMYLDGVDPSLPDQPNYTVLMLVSVAPFFILFFFLFKFVRKRRVHIRYHF